MRAARRRRGSRSGHRAGAAAARTPGRPSRSTWRPRAAPRRRPAAVARHREPGHDDAPLVVRVPVPLHPAGGLEPLEQRSQRPLSSRSRPPRSPDRQRAVGPQRQHHQVLRVGQPHLGQQPRCTAGSRPASRHTGGSRSAGPGRGRVAGAHATDDTSLNLHNSIVHNMIAGMNTPLHRLSRRRPATAATATSRPSTASSTPTVRIPKEMGGAGGAHQPRAAVRRRLRRLLPLGPEARRARREGRPHRLRGRRRRLARPRRPAAASAWPSRSRSTLPGLDQRDGPAARRAGPRGLPLLQRHPRQRRGHPRGRLTRPDPPHPARAAGP